MSYAYWKQFSSEEIDSMHGIEPGENGQALKCDEDGEPDWVDLNDEEEEQENECPRCSNGCNYCLMLDW